jgi:AcrR family transcriptional regulator
MTQTDPIQAQLAAARRNQILDAATSVFAEHGFHRATIKDIAKAAGIADGTIYIYFENKTALLLGILDRVNETERRVEDFQQATKVGLDQWGAEYMTQRMGMFNATGQQVFQILISEMLVNQELRERYMEQIALPTYDVATEFMQQWVESGQLRALDPDLTLRITSGMVFGVLLLQLLGDPVVKERWSEFPKAMAEILIHGISNGSELDKEDKSE